MVRRSLWLLCKHTKRGEYVYHFPWDCGVNELKSYCFDSQYAEYKRPLAPQLAHHWSLHATVTILPLVFKSYYFHCLPFQQIDFPATARAVYS